MSMPHPPTTLTITTGLDGSIPNALAIVSRATQRLSEWCDRGITTFNKRNLVGSIVALVMGLASTSSPAPFSHIVYDDFRGPFSVNTTNAKWFYFTYGSYVASDGHVSMGRHGLEVVAPGKNPATGSPTFTLTAGPHDPNIPGDIDHPKWLAFMTHSSTAGYPGYDTVPGYVTSCEAQLGGTIHGTSAHPLGSMVSPADPALAFTALVTADFETSMIFDFALTNDTIYALYERLPFSRTADNDYASFTHLIPVASRSPTDIHNLKISYDRSGKSVSWNVEGRKVFEVTRPGLLLPNRDFVVIDRGGTEQDASVLRQLVCGVGMFTLVDAYSREAKQALVRLVGSPSAYYRSPENASAPPRFFDETSERSHRLFGQGATLRVRNVVISNQPSTLSKSNGDKEQ
jgi:hypothetical protein